MIISKQQLVSNILTELSDNSTGLISPYDIRHNLIDIVDSVHILLNGKDLDTNNFASLDTRVTKAGKETLKNYNVTNSNNEDNSAFGYSALRNNFQGTKNTALGSSALSCNVYGGDNVAVGYKSVSANTTGYGNVGLGNYTLESNKFGNYNIAIGHSAGYYIGRNDSYRLYIAAHPVDSGYICQNPVGSGLTPLVFGDLTNLKFGIAVSGLHDDGTLQVSGNITPSQNKQFNLGSNSYQFNKLYLSSGITFPSGNLGYSYSLSGIAIGEDFVPSEHNVHSIGSLDNRFAYGYFDELVANRYTTVESCSYTCKTLYLASSGICEVDSPCGYLNDQALADAGFIIQSSGANNSYRRNYYLKFAPTNSTLTQLGSDNVYSRSSWNSNISIHISGGCHLKTDRIIGSGHLSLVTQPSGLGIYIKDNTYGRQMFFSRSVVNPTGTTSLNGIGDVNFLHGSVNDTVVDTGDYIVTVGACQPGVNVSQRFLSNIRINQIDSENNNKQKLKGFEVKYFDDSNLDYSGPLSDRFTINSYDNTSEPLHTLMLMKGGDSEGVVGINDFDGTSHLKLPQTALNIRSSRNAVIRATAESDGYYKSSLQLFGHENCINSGVEFTYYNHSGIADISMYKNSGNEIFIRMDEDGKIGFFAVSGQMDDMITIGGSGHSQAVVSINETIGSVSSTEKYGKVYVKEKIVGESQSASLYFLDSSGNLFDLVRNKYNISDDLVYTDDNRNTLAGNTNYDREALITCDAYDNTAFGHYALRLLSSGDRNVAIGSFAADSVTSGVSNIAIGYGAMQSALPYSQNNIVIGNNFLGQGLQSNDTLLLGNSSYPLMSGNLAQNSRHLFLPNGKIALQNNDNSERLTVSNNTIEVVDVGGDDYPQNQLTFKFTGNETSDLLILKHSGEPLSNTPVYEFANSGIPYAELKGDLRVQNAVRFSDETSLYSSSGIVYTNQLNDLAVEGIAQEFIGVGDFNSPVSGIITTRDERDIYVSNRDRFLQINPNDFVVAIKIGSEYRPIWVGSQIESIVNSVTRCC